MATTITERDRLALMGGVEVIRIYQRTIDETIALMAKIVGAEEHASMPGYFGTFSDEMQDDRQSAHTTVGAVLRAYDVTVAPSSSDLEEPPEGLGQE